jgi:hypothetical protein
MFKIDTEPKFWAPVAFSLPGGETQSFRARFKVVPVSEINKFDLGKPDDVEKFLMAAVCDVDDVEGEDGKAMAFSSLLLSRISDDPVARAAMVKAYFETLSEAARGN